MNILNTAPWAYWIPIQKTVYCSRIPDAYAIQRLVTYVLILYKGWKFFEFCAKL